MAGGGDHQLRTKCGKLISDVGNKEMVCSGGYVPPHDVSAVRHIEQALEAAPKVMDAILLVDRNVKMREPQDDREDELATILAGSGLTDVTAHFMPRRRYRGTENWTCQMRWEGRTVSGGATTSSSQIGMTLPRQGCGRLGYIRTIGCS